MKLVSTLVGLAALGGVALCNGAASAQDTTTSVNVPAGYICNEWGHCWHRHYHGGYGWHRRYWRYGGGYGWHPHYWHRHWGGWGGGYGWGGRWHHWHRW